MPTGKSKLTWHDDNGETREMAGRVQSVSWDSHFGEPISANVSFIGTGPSIPEEEFKPSEPAPPPEDERGFFNLPDGTLALDLRSVEYLTRDIRRELEFAKQDRNPEPSPGTGFVVASLCSIPIVYGIFRLVMSCL